MGSWLFSISPCRIEPYTINPHPGAHRLVYVRRPNELNAFRNAVKTAGTSPRPPNGSSPCPPANSTPPCPPEHFFTTEAQKTQRKTENRSRFCSALCVLGVSVLNHLAGWWWREGAFPFLRATNRIVRARAPSEGADKSLAGARARKNPASARTGMHPWRDSRWHHAIRSVMIDPGVTLPRCEGRSCSAASCL
jgi:hypothetical protein